MNKLNRGMEKYRKLAALRVDRGECNIWSVRWPLTREEKIEAVAQYLKKEAEGATLFEESPVVL